LKKISLVFLFIFSITSGFSQDDKKNILKLNPLGIIFGSGNFSYERAIGSKSSFEINSSFGIYTYREIKYTSFGIGAGYRYYLSELKTAPKGFHLGTGAGLVFGNARLNPIYGELDNAITGYIVNGTFGHQWIFKNSLSIDIGAGAQYVKYNFKDKEGIFFGEAYSGVLPALILSFGYAF
jgi:hypothetical protein